MGVVSENSLYAIGGQQVFPRLPGRWSPDQVPPPSAWEGGGSAIVRPGVGCTPRGCAQSGSRRRTHWGCRSESASIRLLWSRCGCETL